MSRPLDTPFDVAEYLRRQLRFAGTRLAPAERARVAWWDKAIQDIAQQEPRPATNGIGKCDAACFPAPQNATFATRGPREKISPSASPAFPGETASLLTTLSFTGEST